MADQPFAFNGINHLALVCRDMARTVEFYEGVLGMPLGDGVGLEPGTRGSAKRCLGRGVLEVHGARLEHVLFRERLTDHAAISTTSDLLTRRTSCA
jgi:catechol 2,3-dioxygenase-like lactoylglutathione lyase family enzyme